MNQLLETILNTLSVINHSVEILISLLSHVFNEIVLVLLDPHSNYQDMKENGLV